MYQLSKSLTMSQSPSFPSLDQVYPSARSHDASWRSIRRLPSPSLSEVSHRSRSPLSIMSKSREAKSKTSSQQRKQIKYNRRNVFSIDDVNLLFEMSKSETSMGHEQKNNHMNLFTQDESSKSKGAKSERTTGHTRQYEYNQNIVNDVNRLFDMETCSNTQCVKNDVHMQSFNNFSFPSSGPLTSTWSYNAYEKTSRDMTQMIDSLGSPTLDLERSYEYDATENTSWHMTEMNDSTGSLDLGLDWSCGDIKKTRDQRTFYYSLEENVHKLSASPEHRGSGPLTSTWRCAAANICWDMTWMSDRSHETLNLGFYWSYDGTEETCGVEKDGELNNLVDSIINY